MWGLANGEHIDFYRELEKRGKETPLSDMPILDTMENFYMIAVMRLRKLCVPITMQDLAAYCTIFPVPDKARLLDVVAQVNKMETPK